MHKDAKHVNKYNAKYFKWLILYTVN